MDGFCRHIAVLGQSRHWGPGVGLDGPFQSGQEPQSPLLVTSWDMLLTTDISRLHEGVTYPVYGGPGEVCQLDYVTSLMSGSGQIADLFSLSILRVIQSRQIDINMKTDCQLNQKQQEIKKDNC